MTHTWMCHMWIGMNSDGNAFEYIENELTRRNTLSERYKKINRWKIYFHRLVIILPTSRVSKCLQTMRARSFEWFELKHLRFNGIQILKTNEISLEQSTHCYDTKKKKNVPFVQKLLNTTLLFIVSRYHFQWKNKRCGMTGVLYESIKSCLMDARIFTWLRHVVIKKSLVLVSK